MRGLGVVIVGRIELMAKTEKPATLATAPELARLFPDRPVDDGEELQFDFEGPARTLAELALNPDNRTPFTVVVKGGWGRGKTTLLRRAKWLLEHADEVAPAAARRRVETLWFNAWKYPCEDTVLAGLLGALLDKLHKGSLGEQLKVLIDEYKGSLVGKVLYLAAPAPVKDLFGGEGLRSRFSPVAEKRAFHDTFRSPFGQVSRLLFDPAAAVRDTAGLSEEALWTPDRARRETLAVFLDDLDRCRAERVAEVLEAINLFLDLPGVCFYLGIDWYRLVAALPEPVRAQGDQYLEKIVQVALDLPAVSAGGAEGYIRTLVGGSRLGEVLVVGGEPAGGSAGAVAEALASRHPRHVKRFLNDFALTLAVLRNAGKLGQGAEQVPEGAVLAWHLLPELLPAEKWREVRALTVNARTFLRQEAERSNEEAVEAGEGMAPGMRLGAPQLATLSGLTDGQLHLLVHLASPAATEIRGRPAAGRVDLFDLDGDAWVHLPGGTFTMGSEHGEQRERPVHRVTLSPFAISRFPVTNGDYAVYVLEAGKRPPDHWEEGKVPVAWSATRWSTSRGAMRRPSAPGSPGVSGPAAKGWPDSRPRRSGSTPPAARKAASTPGAPSRRTSSGRTSATRPAPRRRSMPSRSHAGGGARLGRQRMGVVSRLVRTLPGAAATRPSGAGQRCVPCVARRLVPQRSGGHPGCLSLRLPSRRPSRLPRFSGGLGAGARTGLTLDHGARAVRGLGVVWDQASLGRRSPRGTPPA